MPRGFKHDTETLERIGRASRRMWARRKAAGKVAPGPHRRGSLASRSNSPPRTHYRPRRASSILAVASSCIPGSTCE